VGQDLLPVRLHASPQSGELAKPRNLRTDRELVQVSLHLLVGFLAELRIEHALRAKQNLADRTIVLDLSQTLLLLAALPGPPTPSRNVGGLASPGTLPRKDFEPLREEATVQVIVEAPVVRQLADLLRER